MFKKFTELKSIPLTVSYIIVYHSILVWDMFEIILLHLIRSEANIKLIRISITIM